MHFAGNQLCTPTYKYNKIIIIIIIIIIIMVIIIIIIMVIIITKKLRGLSPRADYTDRAAAAVRRS